MRHFATPVMLVVIAFAFACASTTGESLPELELSIAQLPASEFVVEQRGAISTAYQMTVRNRSTASVTLRGLEMQTVGRSPYVLRKESLSFDETIAPGQESIVTFSLWAYRKEQGPKRKETVWVQGVADFDGPSGKMRKPFAQSFPEAE